MYNRTLAVIVETSILLPIKKSWPGFEVVKDWPAISLWLQALLGYAAVKWAKHISNRGMLHKKKKVLD